MGAELPKQLLGATPSNEAGHWEPERLVLLHDQMLAEAGSSWRDLRPLDPGQLSADRLAYYQSMIESIIQDEYANAHVFVLKDPRICRFIPIYTAVLSELGVRIHPIIMIRNPLEVSASLSARDNMSNTYGLLLWLRHCIDVEKRTRDMSRAFVSYDRVINDITNVMERLRGSLDGSLPLLAKSLDDDAFPVIRRELYHQVSSPDDVDKNSLTKTWIKEAYRAFQAFLAGRGEKSATARLNVFRMSLAMPPHCFSNWQMTSTCCELKNNNWRPISAFWRNGTPKKFSGMPNSMPKKYSKMRSSMSATCNENPSNMRGKYNRTPNSMPANSRGCGGLTTKVVCRQNLRVCGNGFQS
jgi:hypothetical protein